MGSEALIQLLAELHENHAKTLLRLLKEDPSAAVLKEIREFLKDNGIDVHTATNSTGPLGELTTGLPFGSLDEAVGQ
jgi:hypothetical protein